MEQNEFDMLCDLPANHPFWKNKFMFTRDVFLNESRQMQNKDQFFEWLEYRPNIKNLIAKLQKDIKK